MTNIDHTTHKPSFYHALNYYSNSLTILNANFTSGKKCTRVSILL